MGMSESDKKLVSLNNIWLGGTEEEQTKDGWKERRV
jgi:hypothetical protein